MLDTIFFINSSELQPTISWQHDVELYAAGFWFWQNCFSYNIFWIDTHARSMTPKSAGSAFPFEIHVNVCFFVQCQSDVVMVPRPHLRELPSVAKHDQRRLNSIRNLHNQSLVVQFKRNLPRSSCGFFHHRN